MHRDHNRYVIDLAEYLGRYGGNERLVEVKNPLALRQRVTIHTEHTVATTVEDDLDPDNVRLRRVHFPVEVEVEWAPGATLAIPAQWTRALWRIDPQGTVIGGLAPQLIPATGPAPRVDSALAPNIAAARGNHTTRRLVAD